MKFVLNMKTPDYRLIHLLNKSGLDPNQRSKSQLGLRPGLARPGAISCLARLNPS